MMPLPLTSNDDVQSLADQVLSRLRSAHRAVITCQTQVASDTWNQLINIPSEAKALQDIVTAVQASPHTSKVISLVSNKLPSAIAIADVNAFKTAFDDLAASVEANASVFEVSINPTTKRSEFVTPVAPSIKTAIEDKIAAVLVEVS